MGILLLQRGNELYDPPPPPKKKKADDTHFLEPPMKFPEYLSRALETCDLELATLVPPYPPSSSTNDSAEE